MSLYKKKQFFSSKEYRSYYCFTKVKLLKAISFILDNTYVVFADFVLRQDFGIPIGGNSSSEIANCTLGWCEFVYMRSLVKDKKWNLAKLLSRNSRYVDDLITLNYTNFGKLYSEIYPVGLLMERSGDNNRVINYLDLNITFDERGTPITKLYNKQDSFNFAVVRYPFPSGNMPRLVGHNVFYGQVLRFTALCSEKFDFVASVRNLLQELVRRGYKRSILLGRFRRVMRNEPSVMMKYHVSESRELETLVGF